MTAFARSWHWKSTPTIEGPFPARREDIPALNHVFSDAFTERYRRDGMAGVRVPFLNPAIWRYALEDSGDGAFVWRGPRGEIAAFNVAHQSGVEGWMGPLAVRPDLQGAGIGKEVVRTGIDWLSRHGARVIGLETMPRTMDNIGFYSTLGLLPGRLTLTVTLEATTLDRPAPLLGRLPARLQDDAVAECQALSDAVIPGYDFTREIRLTDHLALGDTVLLRDRSSDALRGFALCHTAPLIEGRTREELRVLKLVLRQRDDIEPMVRALSDYARRSGTRGIALRTQGEYVRVYERLIGLGARVRWTDLRMALVGSPEVMPSAGLIWSNWEV
jgi:GNAT superfamily N-acetyltransferase